MKSTSDRAFKTVASLPRVVGLGANTASTDAQKAVRMRYAAQPDEDDLDREEAEEGCTVNDSYLRESAGNNANYGLQADTGENVASPD